MGLGERGEGGGVVRVECRRGRLGDLDQDASGVGQCHEDVADFAGRATRRTWTLDDGLHQAIRALCGRPPRGDRVVRSKAPGAVGQRLQAVLDLEVEDRIEHGLGGGVIGKGRPRQRTEQGAEHRRSA